MKFKAQIRKLKISNKDLAILTNNWILWKISIIIGKKKLSKKNFKAKNLKKTFKIRMQKIWRLKMKVYQLFRKSKLFKNNLKSKI